MRNPRVLLLCVLCAVGALAALAREVHNQRISALAGGDLSAGWFSFDPDTLYQARRVERLFDEGLPVAGRDPLLNHPAGAAIPWPPYYTLLAGAALAPFAPPAGPARKEALERGVASLPQVFGVANALLAAWVVWRRARQRGLGDRASAAGAACAGAIAALLGSSIHYGAAGNGDHHAFATLCMTALFALVSEAARGDRSVSRCTGAWLGAAAGVTAGVLLGAWVGGLVHVLLVQAALGWFVLRAARAELPWLAPFGLCFHLLAAATLAPAAWSSPWNREQPWSVVNLSWFHPALLVVGALVFAPLLVLRVGSRARRAWPWCVLAGLALLVLALATLDLGPARGVREGFAWASRSDGFMDFIAESQPLLWGQDGSWREGWRLLGLAPLALLAAWPFALRRAFLRGEGDLVVWSVAAPLLLMQALVQRRFGDALGASMAVLVGLGLAWLVARARFALAPLAWAALGLCAGVALEAASVVRGVRRVAAGELVLRGPQAATLRAQRALYRWLGERAGAPGAAVLAAWYHGHAIEWVAERPTIATNFGSYVGIEGYLAPWRFLLERDPAAAEALLEERDARFVLIDGGVTNDLRVMLRALGRGEELIVDTSRGPRPAPQWYATMAGRLVFEGRVLDVARGTAGEPLDFLRLVHSSSEPHALPLALPYLPPEAGPPPAGWIWERVSGARVELSGEPGATLEVALELDYPGRPRSLVWSRTVRCDERGTARLRVPYATDAPNGDGVARGPAVARGGGRERSFDVPERAVLEGARVDVP
jgi:hypothetical protein